jgi:hypothetical protein
MDTRRAHKPTARHQIRPGRAEIVPPGRERLGIILPKNAFANDWNAEPLAERFQHLGRGQRSAGKNVTLDEIDLAAIGLEQAILNGDGLRKLARLLLTGESDNFGVIGFGGVFRKAALAKFW